MNKLFATALIWMLICGAAAAANNAPASDASMSAVVTDMLNWEALLPMYLRTFRASFTQDEIDGVIKFYKSPAGRAYVKKLPLVMQNVMREMPDFMKPVQEKMMAIQRESIQELKDLKEKDDAKK